MSIYWAGDKRQVLRMKKPKESRWGWDCKSRRAKTSQELLLPKVTSTGIDIRTRGRESVLVPKARKAITVLPIV